MTSTPGLGALSNKVDSSVPTASDSAVDPPPLIIVTITAPGLIAQLTWLPDAG